MDFAFGKGGGGGGGGEDPNDPRKPREPDRSPPPDGGRKRKRRKRKVKPKPKPQPAPDEPVAGLEPSNDADGPPVHMRPPPQRREVEVEPVLNPRPFGGVGRGGGEVPRARPDAIRLGREGAPISLVSPSVSPTSDDAAIMPPKPWGDEDEKAFREHDEPESEGEEWNFGFAPGLMEAGRRGRGRRGRGARGRGGRGRGGQGQQSDTDSDDIPIAFVPGHHVPIRVVNRYQNAARVSAAARQEQIRKAHRDKLAKRYTTRFGYNNQRSRIQARQLHITVLRPGIYRVSSDSISPGVQAQIKNLLSRLKKKIAINGVAVISKKSAFAQIISLLRDKQTVEISVVK